MKKIAGLPLKISLYVIDTTIVNFLHQSYTRHVFAASRKKLRTFLALLSQPLFIWALFESPPSSRRRHRANREGRPNFVVSFVASLRWRCDGGWGWASEAALRLKKEKEAPTSRSLGFLVVVKLAVAWVESERSSLFPYRSRIPASASSLDSDSRG